MGKNNAKLSSILPFKEDGCWYLKLVYTYEDKKGKHMVLIPKASVPFVQACVPYINRPYTLELPYINCCDTMTLHEAVSDTASKRGTKTPACCFDIITEYTSQEMTLDEIEKELGYKVKIINKEEKNAEN